jgi:hypothetical protein
MPLETLEDKMTRLRKDNLPSVHIKGEFEIVGVIPGEIDIRGKTYDLRKITIDQAEKLMDLKCPFIQRLKPSPTLDKKPK